MSATELKNERSAFAGWWPVAAGLLCAIATGSAAPNQSATSPPIESPTPSPYQYPAALTADLKRLRRSALESDYAFRQVSHLANNIGPRLSGSPQAQKAVEFVAGELKALGLDVRLEEVAVPHWVRGEEKAMLVSFPGQAEGTTQKIVLTALGGSVATPAEGLAADVVVVRDFDELKALGREKVAGRIVVFNYPFDKQMAAEGRGGDAYSQAVVYRADGPSAAARLGAAAALIRSVGGAEYRLPHTGLTKYATDAPKIPAGALAAEDADLVAALVTGGNVRMQLILTPQQLSDATSYNVVADLRGTDHPEDVVVVSGHLDSWDLGTGAIDDAAGVAVSMEVANLVRKLRLAPTRTIRIIAWMNEENGLAGAMAYAEKHKSEMSRHIGAIETDGGAGHPLGINMKIKPEAKRLFAGAASVLQEMGAGSLAFTEHAGADIGLLGDAGVPTFSPIQDSRFYFNYHHSAADTLDKIVPRELAENAAVVAVLAYTLANLPEPIPR